MQLTTKMQGVLRRNRVRELLACGLPAALFTALGLYSIWPAPSWVGDFYDDGGYYLMSRNFFSHGPVLNQTGNAHWPHAWSPVLSILLSPLGALPFGPGVAAERIAVLLTGTAFVVLAYLWMRTLGLSRIWAGTAAACVAAAFPTVFVGSLILSDVPAAAALLGGVLLLRRGRLGWGMALFALAAGLRTVDVAVLAVVLVWLLFAHRSRRVVIGVAITAGVIGTLILARLLTGGLRTYLDQTFGSRGRHTDLLSRIYHQGKTMVTGAGGEGLAGIWTSGTLRSLGPLLTIIFVALVATALIGFWRRRTLLEPLVIAAVVAPLLVYPGGADTRYLIPTAPLLIGGIAAAFAGRNRLWAGAAATIAAVALASDLHLHYIKLHAPENLQARVAATRAGYAWVRAHLGPSDFVVSANDIQTFLYSGHVAIRRLRDTNVRPVYVVGGDPGPGVLVFWDRPMLVRRIDAAP